MVMELIGLLMEDNGAVSGKMIFKTVLDHTR